MPLDPFVQLDLVVDQNQIVDDSVDRLQVRWPDWEPHDGNLDVAILEETGGMAAVLAAIAAIMPKEAFFAFGTKLYGLTPNLGAAAETLVTLTVVDDAGYTINAGSQVQIGEDHAYAVFSDAVIAPGDTTIEHVQVYATVVGADANGASAPIAQLSLPSFVVAVDVERPTAGGADAETVDEYLDRLSRELRLRAKTIVTTHDFEAEALDFSPEIGRAQAIGDTAREVTVTVATAEGEVVSGPTKTALAAHYELYMVVNETFVIEDPTYTTVDVTWTATLYPGFDAASTEASVNALIASYLSPATFGQPSGGDRGNTTGWVSDSVVRKNNIIALIKSDSAIAHVDSVTLAPGPDGDGNVVMSGDAPLPRPGTISGTAT